MSVVSLSEVHDVLNIPATDTSKDTELQRYIDAAEATVAYIAGPLTSTSYTETRDGGSPVIMLDNCPVISIDSVTEYVGTVAYTLTAQPPGATSSFYGYSLDDPAAGKLVRRSNAGMPMPFMGGRGAIVITYHAGQATLPADVKLAVLEDIRGLYQQTQQGGRSNLGGGAIGAGGDDTWNAGPLRLFPRLAMLLDSSSRTQSIS